MFDQTCLAQGECIGSELRAELPVLSARKQWMADQLRLRGRLVLDAGAIITGKAHCENFCLSGGSHTNAKGPIHNPYKRGFMAGGSSAGSAALVASGEVDMAIAGDQGGSIRIPASNCGCYGMKQTHGLVPYTGAMPIEQTVDHLGPITNNVADNALLLEVLAGEDGLDPRQYKPQIYSYTEALGRGAHGMRMIASTP